MKIRKELKTASKIKPLNVDKETEKIMQSFYIADKTLPPYIFGKSNSDKYGLALFNELFISNAVERIFKYLRIFRASTYFKNIKTEEGPYLKKIRKIDFKHNIDTNFLSNLINYNLNFITTIPSTADFYFNLVNKEDGSGSDLHIRNDFRIQDIEDFFKKISTIPAACIYFRVFENKKLTSLLNKKKLNFYTARIKYIQKDKSILFSYLFENNNSSLSKEDIDEIKKIFKKSLEKAFIKELNIVNEMLLAKEKIADFIVKNQKNEKICYISIFSDKLEFDFEDEYYKKHSEECALFANKVQSNYFTLLQDKESIQKIKKMANPRSFFDYKLEDLPTLP